MRNFTCCFKFAVSLSDETSLFSLNDPVTSELRMMAENTGYHQLALREVASEERCFWIDLDKRFKQWDIHKLRYDSNAI